MTTVSIAQGTQSYCPECNLWKPEFDPGSAVCRDCSPIAVDPEFKALIPPLSDEERTQLEANLVAAGGARDPIVLWGKIILDGHNRFEICGRLGLPYTTVQAGVTDRLSAEAWIIRNQFGRRNLTPYVRGTLALRLEAVLKEQAKGRQKQAASEQGHRGKEGGRGNKKPFVPTLAPRVSGTQVDGNPLGPTLAQGGLADTQADTSNDSDSPDSSERPRTRETISAAAGVSHGTLDKIKRIETSAPEALKAALRSGEATVNSACELTKALENASDDIKALAESKIAAGDDVREITRAVKTATRRAERIERLVQISAANESLPSALHSVIYADPPWRYEHAESESRAIENQYPTMSLDDICALPVATCTTDDAILFLWTTSPKLEEGMRVLREWGFSYRTCMVWDKGRMGMGYYARQQHELLLIGTKGSPPAPPPDSRPSSIVRVKRDEKHSAKPTEFYEIIERMYPELSKLEMFCRSPRDGWAVWGNQSNG